MATAANVYRDFETDGVPASGRHKPKKSDIRQLLAGYESFITAFTSNGGLIYSSLSSLNADLAHGANSMAWVLGDATVANNGVYGKVGASGTGSWTRRSDLPFSFIIASDVGAGTPNAIQATTSLPVSASALVWMNVFEANTGSPVTVSFNGGSALTIKAFDSADIIPGGLTAGMVVGGFVSGSTFRMISDQSRQALIAAMNAAVLAAQDAQAGAEAAQAAAEDARDIAAGYASDAVSQGNVPIYATVVGMGSITVPAGINAVRVNGYNSAGDGGGALYIEAASEPAHAGKFQSQDGRWWELADQDLFVEMFGAIGDDATDNTTEIQNAIDYTQIQAETYRKGGRLYFRSGIYRTGKFLLQSRVWLEGEGVGATIIKRKDASNEDLMSVPVDATLCGWSNITFTGNSENNTSGSGIVVEDTAGFAGDAHQPYDDKIDVQEGYAYRHLHAHDFFVGDNPVDGIVVRNSSFSVHFARFTASYNKRDGLSTQCTDSMFSDFYCEKNMRCGLLAQGFGNKYMNFKSIWNGREDKTFGGWRDQGSQNIYICGEAQDNYTDGIVILGNKPTFIGCNSNQNGYLSFGHETESDQNSADIRVGSSAVGITFIGKVYTYKTAVGSDGLWTTQWPWFFNTFNQNMITTWQVDFDQSKYNAAPNVIPGKLPLVYTGSLSYAGTSLNAGTATTLGPISVSGAGVGDFAMASYSTNIFGNLQVSAQVVSSGNVNVRLENNTASTVVIPAGTLSAIVMRNR